MINPVQRLSHEIRLIPLLLLSSGLSAASAQNVTLATTATTFTLSNGVASLTVLKADGKVSSFTIGSSPNLLSTQSGSNGMYFTAIIGSGADSYSGQGVGSGAAPTFSVTAQTADMVDIELRNPHVNPSPALYPNGLFDLSLHFVMRAGDKGFYTYQIWRHGAGHSAAFLGFPRHAARTAPMFESSAGAPTVEYSTAGKIGQCVGSDLLTNTISDAVYKLPTSTYYTEPGGRTEDGFPVWTKYDWGYYQGSATSSNPVYGVANNNYGFWVVRPSQESFSGGPSKMKAGAQGSVMILDYSETHATTGGIDNALTADEPMEKMFGPIFIYGNSGGGPAAMWTDAQARGKAEVAAWPYPWIAQSENTFPRGRGGVTGRFYVPGLASTPAVVVLGAPGIDWRNQGCKNYLFWATADERGNFTIPKVRPGIYTLYAWTPGALGEFSKSNITVTAGGTTDLGLLAYHPERREKFLWRVGEPDRSTSEFKWGDRFKQFGLWWRYMEERSTSELDYVVGQSNPAEDWYYAQFAVAKDDGTYFGSRWNLKFNLASVPPSPALLTVALAGAKTGAFHVEVNGTTLITGSGVGATYSNSDQPAAGFISITNTGIGTADDSGVDRDAIRSAWARSYGIQFPATLLHTGPNTITIRIRKTGSGAWSGVKPVLPGAGIMYDCVQLEAGNSITPGEVVWSGGGGIWDVNTTSHFLRGGVPSVFTNGDAVKFTGTASPLAVSLTGLTGPASLTVDSANDLSISGPGSLIGLMSLKKSGTGTLVLAGAHSFEGPTDISAGIFHLAGNITNAGIVEVKANSTLRITGALTTGTLIIRPGGRVEGGGLIQANIVNEGVIEGVKGTIFNFVGSVANTGMMRFSGNAGFTLEGAFTNDGTLDLITAGAGAAPTGGTGTVLTSADVVVSGFEPSGSPGPSISVKTHAGHTYRLQRSTTLAAGSWRNLGGEITGNDGVQTLSDPEPTPAPGSFYRVAVSP